MLKGSVVDLEDGNTAQQRTPAIGEDCLAPWGKHKYMAEILGVGGKFIVEKCFWSYVSAASAHTCRHIKYLKCVMTRM